MAQRFALEEAWANLNRFSLHVEVASTLTVGAAPSGRTARAARASVPSGSPRAEMQPKEANGTTLLYRHLDTIVYPLSIEITGTQRSTSITHQTFFQLKDGGTLSTSPPLQGQIHDGNLYITNHQRNGGSAFGRNDRVMAPATVGWHDFIIHCFLDGPTKGWVTIYHRTDPTQPYVKVIDRWFPPGGSFYTDGGQDRTIIRAGMYKDTALATSTIYVTSLGLWDNDADVAPLLGDTTPPATVPATPTGVVLTRSGTTFTASWSRVTSSPTVADYVVERKLGPGPWKQHAIVSQPASGATVSTTWTHTPSDGTVHQVRVTSRTATAVTSPVSAAASASAAQGVVNDTFARAIAAVFNRVADWPNDSATGTTMVSTIGPAGSYGGGLADAVPQPGWISPVPSNANQAHRYWDGVDDVASVPDGPDVDYGNGPLTVIAALRRDRTGSAAGVYETVVNKGSGAYGVALIGNKASIHISGVTGNIVSESGTTNDLDPHLFFFEIGTTTRRIWKDNVDVSVAGTQTTLADSLLALGVGAGVDPGRNFFSGALHVALVRGVLSLEERNRLWAAFNDSTAPAAPTSVDAVEIGGSPTAITVSWAKPALQGDIAEYAIYSQTDGGAFSLIGGSSYAGVLAGEPSHPGTFAMTFGSGVFAAGHTYGFYVTAIDTAGNESVPSATDSVVLSTAFTVPWKVQIA